MKRRRVLFIQLSQFRLFLRKFIIASVVLSAFFIIFLSKADNVHLNASQDFISKMITPLVEVMKLPADGIYTVYKKTKDIFFVYSENKQLKERLSTFYDLQNKFQVLKVENELLSELLHYTPPQDVKFITAKVISSQGDGFAHTLLVHTDNTNSIQEGQIVLHRQYVIGRIESVNGKYARIMLITDINSKIPVFIKKGNIRAILAGNNTPLMNILYTPSGVALNINDAVLTSGIGGMFPTGLPIGYISKISDAGIEATPYALMDSIEYVRIADYGDNEDFFIKTGDK